MHFYSCNAILAHGNKRINGFKDFRGGFQKMAKANFDQWEGFGGHLWKEEVNVRDFIQHNYTQYDGDRQINFGENSPGFRKRSALKEAFSIWRQRLFPD